NSRAATFKLVFFISKKHIEGHQRSVTSGDVLLQVDAIFIVKLRMIVDVLLKHTKFLAHHYYFMKESRHRDILGLKRGITRFENHTSSNPFSSKWHNRSSLRSLNQCFANCSHHFFHCQHREVRSFNFLHRKSLIVPGE